MTILTSASDGAQLDSVEMALGDGRKPDMSTPVKAVSSPPPTSWPAYRLGGGGDNISCLEQKHCTDKIPVEMLRPTVKYEPAGFSAKPNRSLHTHLQRWLRNLFTLAHFLWMMCHTRSHRSFGCKTPDKFYIEAEPCSSRPELAMSGAEPIQ